MEDLVIFKIFIFVLGLLVGSFLNALIFRLHSGEEIIHSRSHCFKCGHVLAWYDLIPLLSWLLLRGRCRYCHSPISIQYPLVEGVTGLLFAVTYWSYAANGSNMTNMTNWLTLGFWLFAVAVLIMVFVYDLKYGLIPDKMILSAILVGVVYQLIMWLISNFLLYLPVNLLTGLGVGLFFFLIIWLTKGRGMGGGDMKLGAFIGLLIGWPNVIVSLYLSFILGAVVGVGLILLGKKKFGQSIPFGPFLAVGAMITLLYGSRLFEWFFGGIFS